MRGVWAALTVVAMGLGPGVAMAEPPASRQPDARIYDFPEPKADDAVVVGGRGGLRVEVRFWPQAVLASPKDLPVVRAMSAELGQHFVRLVGKHRLEDLMTIEQKRALAAKMAVIANGELAARERRAGVAVPQGRVYVEGIVFKRFDMETVK